MFDKETGIFTLTFHVNVENMKTQPTPEEIDYLIQSTQDDPYLVEVVTDMMANDIEDRRMDSENE